MAETVTLSQICMDLAGDDRPPLTKAAISQFVQDGMPKAARGRYDPRACSRWYISRLKSAADRRQTEAPDGKLLSLDDAQIRLTTAKAENEEMTAKERRGELMPLSLHVSETAKWIVTVRSKLLNMPSRLSPRLEGLSNVERRALMLASVKELLYDLARQGNHAKDTPAPQKKTRARKARQKK